MTDEKNIKKFLDEILKSEDNPVQVEYLFDSLREYITDKKEVYSKVLEGYNQDELNKIVRKGFLEYKKRATKIFRKELLIAVIFTIILTIVLAFLIKVDTTILYIVLFTFLGLYIIIRSVAYRKALENQTKLAYEKEVKKEIFKFVEGLK